MPILWTISDIVAEWLTLNYSPRKAYSKVWVVGTTEDLYWWCNTDYVRLKTANQWTALNDAALT